ncbi:Uncharacterised protein [Actinobacillus pleuropneumoniae]|nr:Uncharacterised protein [Actinobacillus pleuropneumoniae]
MLDEIGRPGQFRLLFFMGKAWHLAMGHRVAADGVPVGMDGLDVVRMFFYIGADKEERPANLVFLQDVHDIHGVLGWPVIERKGDIPFRNAVGDEILKLQMWNSSRSLGRLLRFAIRFLLHGDGYRFGDHRIPVLGKQLDDRFDLRRGGYGSFMLDVTRVRVIK